MLYLKRFTNPDKKLAAKNLRTLQPTAPVISLLSTRIISLRDASIYVLRLPVFLISYQIVINLRRFECKTSLISFPHHIHDFRYSRSSYLQSCFLRFLAIQTNMLILAAA